VTVCLQQVTEAFGMVHLVIDDEDTHGARAYPTNPALRGTGWRCFALRSCVNRLCGGRAT
jgi:hypothetical protein